ncbi:DMT family transporter [Streptacidiphilus monticola]|uniref:DMT family transporter n=1 Tax=Streptacidiphilus monticola TaxID=2161674 RepID=A0ABW1G7T5_9ACTN
MSALAVLLALVCAAANGTVSVLQRLAAVRTGGEGGLARLVRCGVWWLGCVALAVAGITQVAALAVGSLSLVQPLLAAELLFTLLIGGLVFHRSPGGRVWAAFLALACGLAVFLVAVDPQEGASAAPGGRWRWMGTAVAVLVACLLTLAWRVRGSLRAASLGLAAATGFSLTAALIKQVTTDASADGVGRIFQQWPLYTAAAVGASSFALLQLTIRSGTLRASQPALTLGDAFLSVVLGRVLFGEHLALGLRLVPAALGAALVAAGVLGLSRGPGLAESWDDQAPQGQHDDRPSAPWATADDRDDDADAHRNGEGDGDANGASQGGGSTWT